MLCNTEYIPNIVIASPTQLTPETAENQPNSGPFAPSLPTQDQGLRTKDLPSPPRPLPAFRPLKFAPIAPATQQTLSSEALLNFITSPAVQDPLAAVRAFAEDAFA